MNTKSSVKVLLTSVFRVIALHLFFPSVLAHSWSDLGILKLANSQCFTNIIFDSRSYSAFIGEISEAMLTARTPATIYSTGHFQSLTTKVIASHHYHLQFQLHCRALIIYHEDLASVLKLLRPRIFRNMHLILLENPTQDMKSEDSKPAFQLRKTYIFVKVLKVEEDFAS
ncbi:unnamed protein product, partial [Allacma fusca]